MILGLMNFFIAAYVPDERLTFPWYAHVVVGALCFVAVGANLWTRKDRG